MKIVSCLVALFLMGCSASADQGTSDSFNDAVDCKQPLGSACTVDSGAACFSYDVTNGTWAKCCAGTLTPITYGPDAAPCEP